jgi:hypothetical protein
MPPGGPPGAPAGFGPQPPPIQPQYPPAGGAPEPPKKTSPLVWVGLGCAVLIFLSLGSGAVAFFLAKRAANKGVAAALSAAAELAVDGGAFDFDAGLAFDAGTLPPGALVTGGPSCARAAECCRRVLEKTGANPQTLAACEELKRATELGCQQALEVHQKSAPLLGTTCP